MSPKVASGGGGGGGGGGNYKDSCTNVQNSNEKKISSFCYFFLNIFYKKVSIRTITFSL